MLIFFKKREKLGISKNLELRISQWTHSKNSIKLIWKFFYDYYKYARWEGIPKNAENFKKIFF